MGFLSVIILSIFLAASSTDANNFLVGGKNGWTTHPSEDYRTWSGRLRFLINDTLSFKYSKETDSVVVVSKDDYDKCNAANPISKLDGGDSTFNFDRSGPFYFITSNKTNCDQGQKLVIVVLALRNKSPPTPPASSPAPAADLAPVPLPESQTPGPSPSSGSLAPTTSAPGANAPGTNGTPTPLSPGNTPSDISSPPGPSKSFAPAVSPAGVVSVLVLSVTVAAFVTFT
ncbi:early nodulin-like protein 2 [Apium graveolens]|uniref:early nodulin-like protein 2 n=1 Tax=Apium graveolens TaxID=4045 RepID=UPI003D7A975E